jgi:hypothetical protein
LVERQLQRAARRTDGRTQNISTPKAKSSVIIDDGSPFMHPTPGTAADLLAFADRFVVANVSLLLFFCQHSSVHQPSCQYANGSALVDHSSVDGTDKEAALDIINGKDDDDDDDDENCQANL